MQVIIGTVGRIYNWFKEGMKENFWKRVFLKVYDTREEAHKEYYDGLWIVLGCCGAIALVIMIYGLLTNLS